MELITISESNTCKETLTSFLFVTIPAKLMILKGLKCSLRTSTTQLLTKKLSKEMARKESTPSKELLQSNEQKKQQRKQKQTRKHNKNGRCYIPLLDSNEPYFVKRREEIDKELLENETDFDEVMDKILKK